MPIQHYSKWCNDGIQNSGNLISNPIITIISINTLLKLFKWLLSMNQELCWKEVIKRLNKWILKKMMMIEMLWLYVFCKCVLCCCDIIQHRIIIDQILSIIYLFILFFVAFLLVFYIISDIFIKCFYFVVYQKLNISIWTWRGIFGHFLVNYSDNTCYQLS